MNLTIAQLNKLLLLYKPYKAKIGKIIRGKWELYIFDKCMLFDSLNDLASFLLYPYTTI